jgi:hypothetical protein
MAARAFSPLAVAGVKCNHENTKGRKHEKESIGKQTCFFSCFHPFVFS